MVKTLKSYNDVKVVLASGSPRRKELLREIFPEFTISVNDAPEKKIGRFPSKLVTDNAREKAMASDALDALVVAADTVVFMDGRYFLKPKDENDATEMLKTLSNRTHFVYTGVALRFNEKITTFYVVSKVKMKNLSSDTIKEYVATGSPLDKAGSYGIQDDVVVAGYSGSFSNIMGLPVEETSVRIDEFLRSIYGTHGTCR